MDEAARLGKNSRPAMPDDHVTQRLPADVDDTHADDLALLRCARGGNWQAFELLVNRYEARVLGLTWRILGQRHDAEDATQQTFLSVMENLDRFREESSVATWVFRIATNHALKMLRKRRGLKTVTLQNADDAPLPRPDFIAEWRDDPVDLAQRAEVRTLIAQALDELDEKYRVVFVLRDVEGLSTKETAAILEITPANVKIRLLRARLQLRERLTQALGDESTRIIPSHDHG